MAEINSHFLKLSQDYLFPSIAKKVHGYAEAHPAQALRIIRCGIGDVTEPLPKAVIAALHRAVAELGERDTFRGYGPEQGYEFLRSAVVEHAYQGLGISADEIFISDGSKGDIGNFLAIFSDGNRVAITDPVYPVYVDTNVMAGNSGGMGPDGRYAGLMYLAGNAENQFVPEIPAEQVDLIYLCFPNNPTGAVASREQLAAWVRYAQQNGSVILFDAAYEAYIQDPAIPHSIYEIPGATEVAVEFRSFSKNGGFTGLRCAYAVVPKTLRGRSSAGQPVTLHSLWARHQSTKFNGTNYPVQRAAAAVFSPEGKQQVAELIQFYLRNAALLRSACQQAGLEVFGGVNAPYLWVACPVGKSSWEMFDMMLEKAQVVTTPGAGFGAAGEGYIRISAFNSRENVEEVCRRIQVFRSE